MKIMVDTNILISAFAIGGKIEQVLKKIVENKKIEVYITEYIDREFQRVVRTKFSRKMSEIFSKYDRNNFTIYPSTSEILGILRDENDVPVLSDAIYYDVDILLTGDKDFLESDVTKPIIMSPILLMDYLQKINFLGKVNENE